MTRVLILDFDGVIVDSIDECFQRCVEAYQTINCHFQQSLDFQNLFYEYRYLVGPASHFLCLADVLVSELNGDENRLTIEQHFYNLTSSETVEYQKRRAIFEHSFFLSRNRSRSSDEALWISQHKIYQQILPILEDYSLDNIYVATMKDEVSAVSLLQYFKIQIPPSNVLGVDFGPNKNVHINSILDRSRVDPAAVTFIDDNAKHLFEVADLGINLAFASWGYGRAKDCEDPRLREVEILV